MKDTTRLVAMKGLTILLVMLFALYPIVELTRLIWAEGMYYHPRLFASYILETAWMWTLYLCIVPFLLWRLKK